MNTDIGHLSDWVGKNESRAELLAVAPATGLAALLNRENLCFAEGDEVPPGWQWLYFLPRARQHELGNDGHPKLGGFLPPIPLPRRMWAAGRMSILRPLRIGEVVTRETRIEDIDTKEGRSGTLVFVKLRHDFTVGRELALTEEQDLVYRAQPDATQTLPAGKAAPIDETWWLNVEPNPVLLFRYSALTFNAHRIHYDRDYAVNIEHYPALVVHSPLIATLLLEVLQQNLPNHLQIREFSFRAIHPTFVNEPFAVCARQGERADSYALWGRNQQGVLTMQASATTTRS